MYHVAPLVGAWIEIRKIIVAIYFFIVAPLVGAWIEIVICGTTTGITGVAPLVGAWIEILKNAWTISCLTGRSPRGSVD